MDIRGLGYVSVLSSDLNHWREYASQVLGMIVAAGPLGSEVLYLKMDERHHWANRLV
jgi:3,4-dihydroxy-9,10-secoandrosta-1,3,5(10)-triene-9,17-dione 4,5-dioxygenase